MGSNKINEKISSAFNDKETKKILVTNTITNLCEGSRNKILQQIEHILKSNDNCNLVASILSGGYTNYSYKVFLDNHPEICLFAKLSFEFALWNPDKSVHYDLQRTENEWKIMKTFSTLKPEHIATPIGCWDLDEDGQKMKLIVTEWSKADEQFSNQFIDGAVDPRIAPKLADTLAELHNIKGFDPNFNQNVKPCMENLLRQMKSGFEAACRQLIPGDRTGAYCVDVGKAGLMKIVEAVIANYHKRDCLVHSDSHVFNVLVEAKPSIDNLEAFGPDGSMVLCDWEMAFAGPIGKDLGLALAFPIGCMIAHAINGHLDASKSLQTYVDDLWDCYSSKLMEAGKNSEEMASIQKNILGWCGCFQYLAFYCIGCQREFFPVDNEEMRKNVHDALGVLGLKLMRVSFDSAFGADYTSSEKIKMFFESLYNDEMNRAYSIYETSMTRMKPRKSSILRASNRRYSDARMNFLTEVSLSNLSNDGINDAAQ